MKCVVFAVGALAAGYLFGYRRARAEDVVTANTASYKVKLQWIDEKITKQRKSLIDKNNSESHSDLECLKWYRRFFTEEMKNQKLWSICPIPFYFPMTVEECDAHALAVIDNDGPYIRTAADHIYGTGNIPR